MKVAVFSHKVCWPSPHSPSGYATDGGFPFQMRALSEIFDETALVVPVRRNARSKSEAPLAGRNLKIVPLTAPSENKLQRRLGMPFWLLRNLPVIAREMFRADAVHAPIPGDVGTYGMVLSLLCGKPLFVRHCGNWMAPRTRAEHFWKWAMERFAGGRNVMLATGGSVENPSARNANVRWIFSSSLSAKQLDASPKQLVSAPARLVIACRQDRLKGTIHVIRSLPLLPEATLDVAGDGSALPELRVLAGQLGVAGRVHFHGHLNHKAVLELLRRSTLFCYPTAASEGFPKVVLEALASGLPVITTRVSVLPQLMSTGCGLLLENTEPESIAGAVRTCLEPQTYPAMSLKALETARNYSLENWRDTIGGYLENAWGPLHGRA